MTLLELLARLPPRARLVAGTGGLFYAWILQRRRAELLELLELRARQLAAQPERST